jgi:hypothetical protein
MHVPEDMRVNEEKRPVTSMIPRIEKRAPGRTRQLSLAPCPIESDLATPPGRPSTALAERMTAASGAIIEAARRRPVRDVLRPSTFR